MFCLKDCTDLGTFFSRNLEKYLKDMTKNLFLIAVSLSKRDSCHLDLYKTLHAVSQHLQQAKITYPSHISNFFEVFFSLDLSLHSISEYHLTKVRI